jgi:hypothetical protein
MIDVCVALRSPSPSHNTRSRHRPTPEQGVVTQCTGLPHCTATCYTLLHYTAVPFPEHWPSELYRTTLHCTVLGCLTRHCTGPLQGTPVNHMPYTQSENRITCHCTVPYRTLQFVNTVRHTTFSCSTLYCTALYCTTLYYTALHCTALHCTVLHCTTLHYTVLHCTVPLKPLTVSCVPPHATTRAMNDMWADGNAGYCSVPTPIQETGTAV